MKDFLNSLSNLWPVIAIVGSLIVIRWSRRLMLSPEEIAREDDGASYEQVQKDFWACYASLERRLGGKTLSDAELADLLHECQQADMRYRFVCHSLEEEETCESRLGLLLETRAVVAHMP